MKRASEAAMAAMLATSLVASASVPVAFELPAGGHYQVTLAAYKPDEPGKPLATFVCGQPFDTTVSNRFVVEWNGLDDNFMPLPPGDYAIKGIVSPAHRWAVDGEYHAISAKWVGGAGEWWPSPDTENVHQVPIPYFGDPVNSPLLDIDVTPEGIAVLGYQYLENGRANPMFDLRRPKGNAQFLAAFPSGGAGGGPCTCTDGETVWACSFDSAPYFVYRPDMRPFGSDNSVYRKGGYLPEGIVTDMAAAKFDGSSYVYVVERGTLEAYPNAWGSTSWRESETLHTDVITVMAGEGGAILAKVPVPSSPTAAKVVGNDLLVLYKPDGATFAIGRMPIANGIPGAVQKLFDVPSGWTVEDFAADGAGAFYFADGNRNAICKTDATGRILATAGRLAKQASGAYDPESLMNPRRLDCWTDASGATHLLVVEQDGPNRVSDWSGADLSYLGEYQNYQLKANCGYAADPDHPEHIYIPGHNDWLVRFRFDYAAGTWTTDAVFEGVPDDVDSGLAKMKAFRVGGRLYFVSTRSGAVFRLSDDGRSVVRAGTARDAANPPLGAFNYHGQNFLPNLTYLAIAQSTDAVWASRPSFDAEGNVSYVQWEKLFSDPYYQAIDDGTATAFTGANEFETLFRSDWMQADGAIGGDIYVQARGGESYSANFGSQHRVTRYSPDGNGGYAPVWRVGRTAIAGSPRERGLIYGGMRIEKPINGILSVIDQSRSGVHLYTEDGLFVDTLFTGDAFTGSTGVYEQPGEFFVGTVYANRDNGKIYYASGKYTPMIYEMEGWDLTANPVRPFEVAEACRTVTLTAARTSTPPAEALRLRKAAGAVGVATFYPEAVGWEGAEPVVFSDGGDTVQVQCLYSREALTLRWKVRKASPFVAKALSAPERLFTHDQGADTVSLYLQCDPEATGAEPLEGRPGDARFTFGIFQGEGGEGLRTIGVGFYPKCDKPGARSQTYHTLAGGTTRFEHVGEIPGAVLDGTVDGDSLGFEIVATIPLSEVPFATPPSGGLTTCANFDANLGGHHRFWWANTDGSASRETYDEPTEARLFPGSWAMCAFEGLADGLLLRSWAAIGPFGGSGARGFSADPNPEMKPLVVTYFDSATFGPDADAPSASATYGGDQTTGWWSDTPATLSWQKVSTEKTDVRIVLGFGAQLYYATTAVYAPEAVAVDAEFFASFMSYPRWKLNGEDLGIAQNDYRTVSESTGLRAATRQVALRQGWNVFVCRSYCNGYPKFKVGLRLLGDEGVLGAMKTAAFAPAP